VYRAVNALQATPWKVNGDAHVVKEIWEAGLEVKGMPSRFDIPLPAKPADFDDNKEARDVAEAGRGNLPLNQRASSKRMLTAKVMYVAEKFAAEPAIYFPIQLDFRGRMYAMPQYLNPQGSDLAKSLLTFAEGKPLGQARVADWLAVHIANTFGYDKCSLEDRCTSGRRTPQRPHRVDGERPARRPLVGRGRQALPVPRRLHRVDRLKVEQGESYVCSLPIMVDGSCNGLQHFSAMLRDEVCGRHVNLIPAEKPSDIYAAVARAGDAVPDRRTRPTSTRQLARLRHHPQALQAAGDDPPLRRHPQRGEEYIMEHVYEQELEAHKPHPFGDKARKAVTTSRASVWQAMGEVVVGPRLAMDWLRSAARVVGKEGSVDQLDDPDRLLGPAGVPRHVQPPGQDQDRRRDRLHLPPRREANKLDGRKQVQALSPNFVHSLDAAALMLTICTAQDRGLTAFAAIHDSYGTLAADMQTLLDTLRECFVRMYQTDVLSPSARRSGRAARGQGTPRRCRPRARST
jgi:DNA-directed RNA polymerase